MTLTLIVKVPKILYINMKGLGAKGPFFNLTKVRFKRAFQI